MGTHSDALADRPSRPARCPPCLGKPRLLSGAVCPAVTGAEVGAGSALCLRGWLCLSETSHLLTEGASAAHPHDVMPSAVQRAGRHQRHAEPKAADAV